MLGAGIVKIMIFLRSFMFTDLYSLNKNLLPNYLINKINFRVTHVGHIGVPIPAYYNWGPFS